MSWRFNLRCGRSGAWLAAGSALLVATTACTVESPASTPVASAPAILFHHATVEQAWQAARAGRRPVVVMFTSDNCPHCERMLAETYGHPAVRRLLLGNSETVLAHASDYRDLVRRLGIRGYPTTVIVGATGDIVDAVEGFVDAAVFARRLGRWMGPGAATSAQLTPASAASR